MVDRILTITGQYQSYQLLSKVLEIFVHEHFSTFLEENNLIALVQSGFRHIHSTMTSLIAITG